MKSFATHMHDDGKVQLPPSWLEELGIREGDTITIDVEDGHLVIRAAKQDMAGTDGNR